MIEIEDGFVQNITATERMDIFIVDHDSLRRGNINDVEIAENSISPDIICDKHAVQDDLKVCLKKYR
jgi:predicted RNA-binding protein with EMAP domain